MTAENASPSQVTDAPRFQEPNPFDPQNYTDHPEAAKAPDQYQYGLQQRVSSEFMHLLGSDFTENNALDDFKQRGNEFQQLVESAGPARLDAQLTEGPDYTLATKAAKLKISLSVLATRHNRDLGRYIEEKLTEKMQRKYHPDLVTEVRFYGTDEDPGRKTGPEAMALLKASYDPLTGKQSYELRGLSIPDEEEEARTQIRRFSDLFQDLADWWQVRSLGSDLVPSQRFNNLIEAGNGEIDEAIAAFEALEKGGNLEEAMMELADVAIGLDVAFASSGVNLEAVQNNELNLAKKTYAESPWLRKLGVEFSKRKKFLHDLKDRRESGLRLPMPPVPAAQKLVYEAMAA